MDIISLRRSNLRKAIDAEIKTGRFTSDASFCEYFDLNPSHISQLVKGHGSFGERAARNLEKKIGWEVGFLDKEDAVKSETSNVRITDAKLTRVPVLDLVQAGHWREVAYDGYNPLGYDYTMYQGSDSNSLFMAIVDGMSMSPDYMPGDAVLVDAALAPKPGCLVLAQQVNQGMAETTFKKYRVIGFNENGCEVVELVPLNPDFPTYSSEQVDISIIGIVVEHRRRLKY